MNKTPSMYKVGRMDEQDFHRNILQTITQVGRGEAYLALTKMTALPPGLFFYAAVQQMAKSGFQFCKSEVITGFL